MPTSLEELLTASDAARVLVMSAENVRRLTKAGVLTACAVTVSPSRPITLYRRADVEALAAKRARPHRLPIPTEVRTRTPAPAAAPIAGVIPKAERRARTRRRR
jgi:D-aminopeptidase